MFYTRTFFQKADNSLGKTLSFSVSTQQWRSVQKAMVFQFGVEQLVLTSISPNVLQLGFTKPWQIDAHGSMWAIMTQMFTTYMLLSINYNPKELRVKVKDVDVGDVLSERECTFQQWRVLNYSLSILQPIKGTGSHVGSEFCWLKLKQAAGLRSWPWCW